VEQDCLIGATRYYRVLTSHQPTNEVANRDPGWAAPSVFFHIEWNYLKQFHALQRVKIMNHRSSLRNRKSLMGNEMFSIFYHKSVVEMLTFRPDD
jgi:hypothetical protein